ncbi:hypothetical protein L249_3856 [Ophiocordyceps polyrhachis-furcata BCC 54312]|uniref:PWI domain-containing protein n=1 Tax=Ophiocordyceps polyrhachis-furcata BCC 54312 TaxID=1330021 RepID=A0A367L5I8_9HYPO|nr:hypothetical protein L249_3856 [Ophiocordyceps polyrhachis-furcata BCC 54312]
MAPKLLLLALGLSKCLVRADVVVPFQNVQPLPLRDTSTISSDMELFEKSCPEEVQPGGAKVIVSSYSHMKHDLAGNDTTLYASSDSLVRGAIDAWAQHQHLVLRPDVVWFEILAQLNLYMTKHAEELRHLFVDFDGQKEIEVWDWTWQSVIDGFRGEIQNRVKTDWLESWITPGFSTSTANDNTTSAVLMMGLMQQYFKFSGGIICGLPSVRLLGNEADWQVLLDKLERLSDFGVEPTQYAKRLRPILHKFVETFKNPNGKEIKTFWKQIVRADKVFSCGAGPMEYDISGWITGFLHWSSNGELRVPAEMEARGDEVKIDNIPYYSAGLNTLPVGYAKAPLKMLDYEGHGESKMAYVLAGNIGIARGSARTAGVQAQPLSGWFLYGPVDVNSTSEAAGYSDELTVLYRGLHSNCPKGHRAPQQRAPEFVPAQPGGKPPLSIFLTNLRLLDLDLLPDWPDISLQTFAASTQSQKRRVQCVEWALFHLVSLWDPDEASNKLKPYFPPIDQLQSLNLRAALLRALESAKKSGVLGRDCIVRKTMLDDCRGDRFDEVLACFSTAVLKEKAAQGTASSCPSASASLSLKDRGYRSDNADLIALVLAHRVSLCRLLERKEVARTRYSDFARLLGQEERAVARRREAVRAQEEQDRGIGVGPADVRVEMDRKVRTNWSADEGWVDALLGSSPDRAGCTGLVAAPFDRVWRRVQQGRLLDLQDQGAGLLDQLDDRVRTQKERLKKWDAFRLETFGPRQESKQPDAKARSEVTSTRGLDLTFLQHQNLQVQDPNDGARGIGRRRPRLTDEDAGLVQDVRDELGQIRCRGKAPRSLPVSRGSGSASETSTSGDDPPADGLFRGTTRTVPQAPTGLDEVRRLRIKNSKHDAEHDSENIWEVSASPSASPCPSPRRHVESPKKRTSTDKRPPPQTLANPCLAAVNDVQGPVEKRNTHRHALSLTQRTCLSMSRADSSILPEDPEPEPALHKAAPPAEGGEPTAFDNVADDLVNRTRRSMAGMEKAKQKAWLERRRSERKARTSPRKESALFPTPEEEPEQRRVLTLDPMDEEDMEAVFRSRPKLFFTQYLLPSTATRLKSRLSVVGCAVGEFLENIRRVSRYSGIMAYNNQYSGIDSSDPETDSDLELTDLPLRQGNPYGAPPGFGGYNALPPGVGAAPPGLGPLMGMTPAPGVSAPPGTSPSNVQQANRPGGIPPSFQPPANMPNINFNAPIIRLGTVAPTTGGRGDGPAVPSGGRSGLGMDRGGDQGRDRRGDAPVVLQPLTPEEKLMTIMLTQIPEGVGGDEGVLKICNAIGRLRKWDSSTALWSQHRPLLGFATFDDADSFCFAFKLLRDEKFKIPVKKQQPTANPSTDESFAGIEKTVLNVAVDYHTLEYYFSLHDNRGEDPDYDGRLEQARAALKKVQMELFYPPLDNQPDGEDDVAMTNADTQKNVEVVNISIAQDDELSEVPAEMREVVAKEIAAFRDRSTQRDMERLRREEEIGERFRKQNGASAASFAGANNIPLGPRAATTSAAPTGPKGQGEMSFVNGGHDQGARDSDEDTDASDEERYRRKLKKKEDEDTKRFLDLEAKWIKREKARQSALDREHEREEAEAEQRRRRKEEQESREAAWDDATEAVRKSHLYYSDNADWITLRMAELRKEEELEEADRREEQDEIRRAEEQMNRAMGQANSFLDQQDQESNQRQAASANATDAAPTPAPQPFKLSLGAAAQRAQASRNVPRRRTIAEVEGLLDDEDTEPVVRRPLVPIQPDAISAADAMTEEEISQAVRVLAQEIPSDKEGLWKWDVKWEHMDDHIVGERLRPFVEKKIVEYLGVQEEMLVQAVEEQIRKRGTAATLAEELGEALGDEAEDLVKKLWRMIIFFTECEKRGLPT